MCDSDHCYRADCDRSCPDCFGTGEIRWDVEEWEACTWCAGWGCMAEAEFRGEGQGVAVGAAEGDGGQDNEGCVTERGR